MNRFVLVLLSFLAGVIVGTLSAVEFFTTSNYRTYSYPAGTFECSMDVNSLTVFFDAREDRTCYAEDGFEQYRKLIDGSTEGR